MRRPRVLAVVLAGGAGSRLGPLTEHRAKPSLRLAGTYRLIDVVLSNIVHSGIDDVRLIEQFVPRTLDDHVAAGRPWDLDRSHGGLRVLSPFTGEDGEGFARGNSDSLWRHRRSLEAAEADLIIVLSADHLYTLDLSDVVETHLRRSADLTVVTTQVPHDPSAHGVVEVDADGTVTGFAYKPQSPETDLVACEIFCFTASVLLESLEQAHAEHGELGDWGEDLIPHLLGTGRVVEHRLEGYWRGLGTPEAYWQAHQEILDGTSARLDDPAWPIRSAQPQRLPARVGDGAEVRESLLSPGCAVEGSVRRSVIGPGAVIEEGAEVVSSIVLDDARIPAGARVERCIVDIGAAVAPGVHGDGSAITVIDADGNAHRPED